jgi:hypothetical protein
VFIYKLDLGLLSSQSGWTLLKAAGTFEHWHRHRQLGACNVKNLCGFSMRQLGMWFARLRLILKAIDDPVEPSESSTII